MYNYITDLKKEPNYLKCEKIAELDIFILFIIMISY